MAKSYLETHRQCKALVEDIRRGVFKSVYLLMGEESYYPDMVCQAIIDNAMSDEERDFNQTVCYGLDVDADFVITAARSYPMMGDRVLVVVKEAQNMKTLDQLSLYCEKPLDSTVLVILMHGASADKRKALYKSVLKVGVVVESDALRDYEIASWISDFYSSKGLKISPEASALLGEYAGTDLSKISVETEKLLKNLPEGAIQITVEDIENNVGISRQYSIFELTKELSYKNTAKALKVAAYLGNTPKFAMPMAVSALFMHFYRILKYEALLMSDKNPGTDRKVKVLGVNPYFMREYEAAAGNYPLRKCMAVISLLDDYDYKGKGGEVGEATADELLVELVTKISLL